MLPMRQVGVLTGVGGVLVVLCAIFMGVFPTIYNSIVDKMLVLKEDSETLDAFIVPPVPVYMAFYLFNVTNPDDIRFKGAKPILKEAGPYTYQEYREKYDLDWNHEEGTVTYLQNKSFVFREDLSDGNKEEDMITTINAVMVSIASKIAKENRALQAIIELILLRFGETVFMTRPVKELLWGYPEPLLNELSKYVGDPTNNKGRFGYFYPIASALFTGTNNTALKVVWSQMESATDLFITHSIHDLLFYGYELPYFDFDFSDIGRLNMTEGMSGTLADILDEAGVDNIPEFLIENKLGLYSVNGTNDGNYTVKTGEKGIDSYLNIIRWKGMDELDYWSDHFCDMINGTDGSQFPPRVAKDSVLYIYTSEMCRSLYLTFEKEVDFLGISCYRFIPPKEMLEDPLINDDNMCYCYPTEDDCLGAGFLNMAPCAHGAPVIMSTPHFYQGDMNELQKLEGLNPSKENHETILDIEPRTGVAMNAAKKIQINVPLKRYGDLPSFKNVPEVIFPVLWVNEYASITPDLAGDVQKAVDMPFLVVNALFGSILAVGVILLAIAGYKFRRIRRNRGQQKL